jgi:hypothetical protein
MCCLGGLPPLPVGSPRPLPRGPGGRLTRRAARQRQDHLRCALPLPPLLGGQPGQPRQPRQVLCPGQGAAARGGQRGNRQHEPGGEDPQGMGAARAGDARRGECAWGRRRTCTAEKRVCIPSSKITGAAFFPPDLEV